MISAVNRSSRNYAGPNGEKITVSSHPMPPYIPNRRKPLIQRQVIRLKTPEPLRKTVRRRLPTPERETKIIMNIVANDGTIARSATTLQKAQQQPYDSNISSSTSSSRRYIYQPYLQNPSMFMRQSPPQPTAPNHSTRYFGQPQQQQQHQKRPIKQQQQNFAGKVESDRKFSQYRMWHPSHRNSANNRFYRQIRVQA